MAREITKVAEIRGREVEQFAWWKYLGRLINVNIESRYTTGYSGGQLVAYAFDANGQLTLRFVGDVSMTVQTRDIDRDGDISLLTVCVIAGNTPND